MENSSKENPPFLKEACSAVCAVVHANINDSRSFIQSGSRKKPNISSLGKQCFSDNGVIVEHDQGMITITLHVNVKAGHSSIYKRAIELQESIMDEVFLLTSFKIKKVNILITSIHASA